MSDANNRQGREGHREAESADDSPVSAHEVPTVVTPPPGAALGFDASEPTVDATDLGRSAGNTGAGLAKPETSMSVLSALVSEASGSAGAPSIQIAVAALEQATEPTNQAIPLAAGAVVSGRYEVLSVLGAGGMGTVYRVLDRVDGLERALKLPNPGYYGTAAGQLCFRQEFHAMAALVHPNLPRVLDYGLTDEASPYLVMELIAGRPIAVGTVVPMPVFYRFLVQVLRALSFIHSRGFLHRDIKPDNALIGVEANGDTRLVLLDFGLMERIGTASDKRVAGTPSYMAPEIINGQMLDPRTDLYALGISAYLLLTGRLPFRHREMLGLLQLHGTAPRPRVSALLPDIPPALDELIYSLMAIQPQDRPASAEDVLLALAPLTDQVQHSDLDARKSYLRISDIVGRDAQRQALRDGLERATGGAQAALGVQGVAGSGKSRLLIDIRQEALVRGFAVSQVAIREDHRAPFQALRTLLRGLLPVVEDLAAAGANANELPELGWLTNEAVSSGANADASDGSTAGVAGDPGQGTTDRGALTRDVRDWLNRLGTARPVLLLADDLQWCDDSSMQVLRDLIQPGQPGRILLIGTCRGNEVQAGSDLDTWRHREGIIRLETPPFDASQMGLFLRGLLGRHRLDEAFVGRTLMVTEGNPFYTIELLRDLIDRDILVRNSGVWQILVADFALPTTVTALLGNRLERLGTDGRETLRLLAVAGGGLPTTDLAILFGADDETRLLAGVEDAVQHSLAVVQGRLTTLIHDSIRQLTYASMDTEVRADLHQRLAEYLDRRLAQDNPARAALLGHHFARGRDPRRGLDELERAGRRAFELEQQGAARDLLSEAEELLECLGDVPDRYERLYRIKKMLSHLCMSSDFERGAVYAEWVYQHAMERGVLRRLPRLKAWLPNPAPWVIVAGIYLPIQILLRRRAAMREFQRDFTDVLTSTSLLSLCLASSGKLTTARQRAERLSTFALTRGGLVNAFVTIAQTIARNHQDGFRGRADYRRAGSVLRSSLARPIPLYQRVLMRGTAHYAEALYSAWEQHADYAVHLAALESLETRHDHLYLRHLRHQVRLEHAVVRGDVAAADQAEADFRATVDRLGGRVRQREWLVDLAMGLIDIDAGRIDRASRRIGRLRDEPPGYFTEGFAALLAGRLNLEWRQGDAAIAELQTALRWARDPEIRAGHFEFRALTLLADAHLANGNLEGVSAALDQMAPFARDPAIRTRYFAVEISRRRARVLADSYPRAALNVARETLETARTIACPRQLAACHLLLAQLAGTCGLAESESDAHLDAARQLYEGLGNPYLASRAAALRDRTGVAGVAPLLPD